MVNLAPPKSIQEFTRYKKWLSKNDIPYRVLSPGDQVDGTLLLSGGSDIGKDKKRDHLELKWIQQAMDAKLPILGICRGMQLVNYFQLGAVKNLQIEENHCVADFKIEHGNNSKPSMFHKVTSEYGLEFNVNSRHHQHCATLGIGLKPIFWAPDGTIEAAVGDNILLVQWHPERKETKNTRLSSRWPANWLKNNLK
jgi:putative glutamine amidotransferase